MKNKIFVSSALIIISIFLFLIGELNLPYIDKKAKTYFEDSIEQAAIAYGTAVVINSTVSVIKESEIQIEPGGVGISFALGQILDPIDDLTERVSAILITVIASLGAQKILFELSNIFVPKFIAIILLFYAILNWLEMQKFKKYKSMLLRLLLIFGLARIFLPIIAIGNQLIDSIYFDGKLKEVNTKLSYFSSEISQMKEVDFVDSDSWWDSLTKSTEFLSQATIKFKKSYKFIRDNFNIIIDTLITYTWLHIGMFLIRIILSPLLVLWLMIKIVKNNFNIGNNISLISQQKS